MINYEHIKTGIAVINEFRKELKVLCEEYQQKLDGVCPENISKSISRIADNRPYIHLVDISPEGHYTKDEIIEEGFELKYDEGERSLYSDIFNCVEVVCTVHNEEDSAK